MAIETLFKYGALTEHSRSLFATPYVWFSAGKSLNDPFELKPWFEFNGSETQIVELLATSIQKRSPHFSTLDALAEALSVFKKGLHSNPSTWEALRRDIVKDLGRKVGVYCMSTTADSILMWSHYGRNHEGYCLEFIATDQTPFFGDAQEVKYQSHFPVVNFFNTPNEEQVDLIFLTKFEGWSYEGEYRIVDHVHGPGLHEYPSSLLKSVTFGLRMPEQDKFRIRQWLSHRSHKVELFQANIDNKAFKVVRSPVQ